MSLTTSQLIPNLNSYILPAVQPPKFLYFHCIHRDITGRLLVTSSLPLQRLLGCFRVSDGAPTAFLLLFLLFLFLVAVFHLSSAQQE